MASLRRREWLALAAALLLAVAAAGSVEWRRRHAQDCFDRELAFLQGRGAALTPQEVVAAALRLPRDRFLVKVLGKGLETPGNSRLLASTAIEYWDAQPRDDGLLPRPEHHARPIRELLPLLPQIARAQRDGADGEVPDACLVTIWDPTTLTECGCRLLPNFVFLGPDVAGHQRLRGERESPMHHELLGVLLDKDPRPMTKDGFSGLVYAYAKDEDLVAAIGSLCSATPR